MTAHWKQKKPLTGWDHEHSSSGTNHLIMPPNVWCQRVCRCCCSTLDQQQQQQQKKRWGVLPGKRGVWKRHLTEKFQRLFANTSSLEERGEVFLCMCALLKIPRRVGHRDNSINKRKNEQKIEENAYREKGGAMKNTKKRRRGVKALRGMMEMKIWSSESFFIWHMPVHTERCSHDVTLCRHQTQGFLLHPPVSEISVCCGLLASVNETLTVTRLSSLSLSLQSTQRQSEQPDLLKPSLSRGWMFSPPCPIPFVPQMAKMSSLFVTGLMWHCSTSGFLWREGQEVENPHPHPLPLTDHWALFIAGPLQVLSPNQNEFQWGRGSCVTFYGLERGGSWWSGGFLWPVWGACVSTPTICSLQTQRQRHADTHCLLPCVQS